MVKQIYSIIFILLFSLIASVSTYAGFGASDDNGLVPMLNRMLDNSYLTNDWYVNTTSEFINVRFYFHTLLQFLYFFIPNLPILYFLLFIAFNFSIGLFTYLISFHFFKNKQIGLLSSFLVLFAKPPYLGGSFITNVVVTPSSIAIPFVLGGFYFLLKKRYNLFSLFLGFATLIHFTIGHLLFGILFLSSIYSNRSEKNFLKKHLIMLGIFLLFSLSISPIIFSQMKNDIGLTGEETKLILADFRHPMQYSPLTWGPKIYFGFLFFFLLFIYTFKKSKIKNYEKRLVKSTVFGIFLYFLIGFFFTELIPISLLIKFQFFRTSFFIYFLGFIFMSNYIYTKAKVGSFELFICILLIISFFHQSFILVAFPLFILFDYFSKRKINKNLVYILICISLFALFIFHPFLIDFVLKRYLKFQLILFKTAIFIPFFFMIIHDNKIIKKLGLTAIILSSIIMILISPSIFSYTYDSDTLDVYNFIKKETPTDAIFLTPPHLITFKLGANRANVVDFKSFPFSEKTMVEWYTRMMDVTDNYDPRKDKRGVMRKGYRLLPENKIEQLKEKYHFSYALFEKPKQLSFPVTYENKKYIIYKVNQD